MNFFQEAQKYWAMFRATSKEEGPLVRWGVLFTVVVLLWTMLLTPWLDWKEERESLIEVQRNKAARLMGMQSRVEEWSNAENSFRQTVGGLSAAIFESTSDTGAQAELQLLLRGLVKKNGLNIQSQRFMDSEGEGDWGQRIRVSMNLKGDVEGVYHLLGDLARHPKILVIEKLFLGNQPIGLMVQIQVAGFRHVSENEK